MSKKETINPIKDLYNIYVQIKRKNLGEVPEAILNTMDIVFKNDEIKPLLIKDGVKQYEGGWHFVFTLNPGCSYEYVYSKKDFFDSVVKGKIEFKRVNNFLHIDVTDFEFADSYKFDILTTELFKKCLKMYLPIPIGIKPGGKFLFEDMEKFSHLMIGGVNNSGKSVWIRQCLLFLAKFRPDVGKILIDFKRTDAKPMKKIALVGTNLDEAHFYLENLCLMADQRLTQLENNDCFKASELNLPPVICIIDELAQMEDKVSQKNLRFLAQMGRAAGIHLIASLQRPTHTTYKDFTTSRSQFAARLGFHMVEQIDSELILGRGNFKAYEINAEHKGRAIFQYGKETEVQSIFVDQKDVKGILKDLEGDKFESMFTKGIRLLP